jgi:DNA-3-methyladenine glycosylase
MKPGKPLPSDFYLRDTVEVARSLLGCILWRRIEGELLAARIVETEAYLGARDDASHARRGLRSERNKSMYLEGGRAYVYFTYGMHYCMNVVTNVADVAEAVLLRAGEPLLGLERIRANRPAAKRDYDLLNGPAKLCAAFEIDRDLDGHSLRSKELFITAGDSTIDPADISATPRIGVDYAGEAAHWPLRFFLTGNRYVSVGRTYR